MSIQFSIFTSITILFFGQTKCLVCRNKFKLKNRCSAKIIKYRLAYFHVISLNAKYTTKLYRENRSTGLEKKCKIARIEVDYSSSNLSP